MGISRIHGIGMALSGRIVGLGGGQHLARIVTLAPGALGAISCSPLTSSCSRSFPFRWFVTFVQRRIEMSICPLMRRAPNHAVAGNAGHLIPPALSMNSKKGSGLSRHAALTVGNLVKCPDTFGVKDMLRKLTPQNRARLSMALLWMGFLLPAQLCTGAEAQTNSKPLTLETYLQQLGYGSIHLKRTEQNHLAVEGELAGKKAVFLIDTGNSITRLDKKVGSRFKTLAERGIRLEDPNLGELPRTNIVLVDEMKLGTARFPNQPANVTALAHVATSRYEIDTIAYEDCLIGCDFLLRHHCLLDIGGLKLYVRADKPTTDMRAALESSLRRSGYHETVLIPTRALVELCPAKVNRIAVRLLVDSGSVFTVLDDHQGKQSPLAKLRVSNTDTLSQGVGKRGGTPIYVAEPESFELDGIQISLRKIRLGVSDLISFNIGRYGSGLQNADGILGADVLAVSGSLVDLENRRLWFVIPKNVVSSKPQ